MLFLFFLKVSFDMTQILYLISVHTGLSHILNLLFLLISMDTDDAQKKFLLIHRN